MPKTSKSGFFEGMDLFPCSVMQPAEISFYHLPNQYADRIIDPPTS